MTEDCFATQKEQDVRCEYSVTLQPDRIGEISGLPEAARIAPCGPFGPKAYKSLDKAKRAPETNPGSPE